MFTIYGGKTEFNQWEQGHRVTNPKLAVGDKVRFWNASGETHPMIAYMHEGVVVADVPNDLLQHYSPILVELCGDPECLTRFIVNAQDKPADYVFIDNTHCAPVTPSGGSGGVSSWNDLTDKPFYKEETLLWSAENAQAGRLGRPMTIQDENGTNIFFGLKVGGNYQVEYDGKVYPCTAFSWATGDITGVAIGNSALMPSDYTSDEPNNSMSILFLDSEGSTACCIEDTDEHSVKVSDVSIHRIDPEYLPEGYPYKETSENVLVAEQSAAFSEMASGYAAMLNFEDFSHLAIGDKLKVLFDGEEYICTVGVASEMMFAGNAAIMGMGENTGEPFIVAFSPTTQMAAFATLSTDATHIIGITEITETIHTMSPEFLPAGVGGGAFIVTATADASGSVSVDKTFEEVKEQIKAGNFVALKMFVGPVEYTIASSSFQETDYEGFVEFSYGSGVSESGVQLLNIALLKDNSVRVKMWNLTATQMGA